MTAPSICDHCRTEGVDITTYRPLEEDLAIDLCRYCENTSQAERQNDMTRVLARFLHVLEGRLNAG